MISYQPTQERLTRYNVLVICAIGLGSLSFGYAGAVIGTLLGQPSFQTYFDLATRPHATQLESSMNGVFQAGAFCGTLAQPWIADKWGRRWALAVPAALIFVAGAIMAGSTHIAEFIVFRFVSGAGAYMLAAGPPLLMSELVPSHYRGSLVELHAIFFEGGYIISSWVGFGSFFWKNNVNTWRLSVGLQCLGPVLLVIALVFIPESPRWLIMQDRMEEAGKILEKIHPNNEAGREQAAAQLQHIHIQADLDRQLGSSWGAILAKPAYRKRFMLGIATTGIIQFSGVLVISTYGTVIYDLLAYDSERQLLFQALFLTVGGTVMMAAPFVVDRVPRNRLMGVGMVGCAVVLSILAAIIANFASTGTNSAALKAGLSMIFLYQPFFVIGLDGTQYVYLGEIFPNHLRAKGVCSGTAMIALVNILWLQLAETALETIGWKYFLVFIIPSFLGGICIWQFWPDTRNMPLEEISALFGDEAEVAINPNMLEEKDAHGAGVQVEQM
ncbi:hypothetical protein SEUCBS140593_010003 [Sporothrix eucalyptigena]|uniref:Major facilitator superfamily (MFS) profile domain-containing protein n=1 Tax=Sporothrix eucalyptigena TaxID=1812306 RepID=A0ABP0D187_9PEZI